MRRGAIVLGILALFLSSLVLTSQAEARAGGSSSSGSRGSRSYSAPRSPSAPSSPATPSAPTAPPRSDAPTRSPRPGFGWGGMIGGFLLGGLLGGLLFGGLGHGVGGVGLLDLVLIGGLVWLAFAFFRRRQEAEPEPAYAAAPGASEWPPAEAATAAPTEAGDADLEHGIAAIRTMDPGFTPLRFVAVARDVFVRVQSAWTAGDLGPVRADLTEEMAGSLEADLGRLKAQKRVNRLDKVTVESAEPTEAWQEYGQDFVTVRFRASALDYTLDEATGAVVEGSNSVPTRFEEYWTLARPVGPNPWRLTAIQQPG